MGGLKRGRKGNTAVRARGKKCRGSGGGVEGGGMNSGGHRGDWLSGVRVGGGTENVGKG